MDDLAFDFLMAVQQGDEARVLELEKGSVDVMRWTNPTGNTALMLACAMGHERLVECLVERSDPDHVNQNGDTALMMAAAGGQADTRPEGRRAREGMESTPSQSCDSRRMRARASPTPRCPRGWSAQGTALPVRAERRWASNGERVTVSEEGGVPRCATRLAPKAERESTRPPLVHHW